MITFPNGSKHNRTVFETPMLGTIEKKVVPLQHI